MDFQVAEVDMVGWRIGGEMEVGLEVSWVAGRVIDDGGSTM